MYVLLRPPKKLSAYIYNRPNPNRDHKGIKNIPIATYLRCEGFGSWPDPLLQTVQVDQAIPTKGYKTRRCRPSCCIVFIQLLTDYRVRRTDNPRRTAKSWMVFTNASSVLAARLHAHHTGGTLNNTLDLQFCYSLTDGWPIPVMREQPNDAKLSRTAWACIDATPFSTARGRAPRVSTQPRLSLRSRRAWLSVLKGSDYFAVVIRWAIFGERRHLLWTLSMVEKFWGHCRFCWNAQLSQTWQLHRETCFGCTSLRLAGF